MSETEQQNAVVHEEKAETKQEEAELKQEDAEPEQKSEMEAESESKAEPAQEADQSEVDQSVADESTIVDSSINAEKSDANAGDDEESDSDESLPPGLLERPVEILEAKRERKKIKRFTYDDEATSPAVDKKKAVEIPKGNGIRIGDHPRVEYQLQRNSAEDLKIIHQFFYNAKGNSITCKKNLREFCGFVMQKDTPEYEKKEEFIGKFTVDNLKWAMTVCDVPNIKGNKDELIDSFMDWCLCPKPQDKPVPEKRKKKEPAQKKKKKVKRSAKAVENGDATSDGATPVKKRKKNTDSKKKSTGKKSTPNKKAKIKISKPKSKAKVAASADNDSSDDEPLMQKQKSPPTNAEIRKFIEVCLKGADLGALTMKSVIIQVYEQFPDFDLTDKKGFIKETVKKIIS